MHFYVIVHHLLKDCPLSRSLFLSVLGLAASEPLWRPLARSLSLFGSSVSQSFEKRKCVMDSFYLTREKSGAPTTLALSAAQHSNLGRAREVHPPTALGRAELFHR